MAHANTTKNFQKNFNEFEYENIVKACDSGVFTKNGCQMDYNDLFAIYDNMGTEYGIIIDFLKDKAKTILSAEEALKKYNENKHDFKLVGVAQGNTIDEYLECYKELRNLGYDHIAVGGLLQKNVNTARYVKVFNEDFLKEVLQKIRENYRKDWLFALGCYHPKRHRLFDELNLFGADYKGWILKYKTPHTLINNLENDVSNLEGKIKNTKSIYGKNNDKIDIEKLNREKTTKLKVINNLEKMSVKEKRNLRFAQNQYFL